MFSNTIIVNAPTKFSMLPFFPAKLGSSSTSPLRIAMDIQSILTTTGYISVTLGSSFSMSATVQPFCTLRNQNSFAAPYLTYCTYDATNKIYKLTPLESIPTGRYLILITTLQQNLASEGMAFPTTTGRVSAVVQVNSASSTIVSVDSVSIATEARKSLPIHFF